MIVKIFVLYKKCIKNKDCPFFAHIVKNNRVISYGYNRVTSKKYSTLYVGINAIRKISKKLKIFDLKWSEIVSLVLCDFLQYFRQI